MSHDRLFVRAHGFVRDLVDEVLSKTELHRARRLLKEGHDPAIVREITGLKLAELDLIGSAPETLATSPGAER